MVLSLVAFVAFVVFFSIHTNYGSSSKMSDKNSMPNVKKTDKKKKQ